MNVVVPWDEPADIRTAGRLPVRPHLRPQPTARDWAWFYNRRASGRFDVEFMPAEYADEMVVEGEA